MGVPGLQGLSVEGGTMLKRFVMTRKKLRHLISRYGEAKCNVCGESFCEGDWVLSKCVNRKARRVHAETCKPVNW